MRKLILILFLFVSLNSFAQTDDKARLKELNQSLVNSYKNNKFDDAQKYAEEALQVAIKVFGNEDKETARVLVNLGIIQRERKKYDESSLSLQKAVDIYERHSKLNGEDLTKDLINASDLLAISQYHNKKKKESVMNFLKAFNLSETKIGKYALEGYSPALHLAKLYSSEKEYQKADEFYLKSYAIALKNFGKESDKLEEVFDSRICSNPFEIEEAIELNKLFSLRMLELKTEILGQKNEDNGIIYLLNGDNTLNANNKLVKATFLARPVFPENVRGRRISKQVKVKVFIDEKGNVKNATALCSQGVFETASVAAALQSKFSTNVNGKPYKIVGIIIYNFGSTK
ncbi:MAG: tetratricopeptide repeat protein [Pyrinomonadaceae bacterium]|nr:tetratricopeptide repeat protein [Pyrinomonadaceae bacterium]